RLGQPAGSEVVSERRELGLERLVRAPVLLAEELHELVVRLVLVGAEQEVPAVEGGQEVVRVPTDQRQVEVERGEQLWRHQAEQVRPRGGAQARRLPEG